VNFGLGQRTISASCNALRHFQEDPSEEEFLAMRARKECVSDCNDVVSTWQKSRLDVRWSGPEWSDLADYRNEPMRPAQKAALKCHATNRGSGVSESV
jgi:hypothetical protein